MQTKLITENEYAEYAKTFNEQQKDMVAKLQTLTNEQLLKVANLLSYEWNKFEYVKSKKQFVKISYDDIKCKYYFENNQTFINYIADINGTLAIPKGFWELIK